MKIVIIGCGMVGKALIRQFSLDGYSITAIDSSESAAEKVVDEYGVKCVVGNGANSDIQKEANAAEADFLIACTASDELNILCCMVAKNLGAAGTISRIKNREYFTIFMGKELGINMTVNSEFEASKEIFRILRFPAAERVGPLGGGRLEFVEFKVNKDSPVAKLSLLKIRKKHQGNYLICTVQRGEQVIIPKSDFALAAEDKIVVTGEPSELHKLFKSLNILQTNLQKVIIVGGSGTACYLAAKLKALGLTVKIIEKDEIRCHKIAEMLPKVEIIHADGTDGQVLMEEGIAGTDALIALTNSDEQNSLISLFAKGKGVKKVVAKINRTEAYTAEEIGADSIISPKELSASIIARYVEGKKHSKGSLASAIYRIANDRAKAWEFLADSSFSKLGVPLKDLFIKENILIAAILRANSVITPSGSSWIEDGDSVIVVSANRNIDGLDDILIEGTSD